MILNLRINASYKMNITPLFKDGVNAAKIKQSDGQCPKRILPKSSNQKNGQRDEFAKEAKEVCNKITTLRNVLIENRSAYMKIGQHLKSAVQMTDEQRDLIDRESEKFLTFYTQYIGQMRNEWKKANKTAQQRQHIEAVLELLSSYLKAVQHIYLEQKKYRVQHELESYRLLKLASDKKKIPIRPVAEKWPRKTSNVSLTSSKDFQTDNERRSVATSSYEIKDGWDLDDDDITLPKGSASLSEESLPLLNTSFTSSSMADSKAQVALNEDMQKSQQLVDEAEKSLSPEDVQMFEEENVQLYHELHGLSDEVEAIGKNVVDIATLQDIFTEKVTLQQHNIERIVNAVVGSTENVKDANDQIQQAIQRNAGLRVWSLFFLLVMSFALLFLDWYYD